MKADHEKREFIRALSKKRTNWVMQEESKGFIKIIRQHLFADKSHFILELIQNADDYGSTSVEFKIQPNRVIVLNDGHQFTEKNVEKICLLGSPEEESNKIGYFGIGFKSVFGISHRPEVHSGGYHFSFDWDTLIAPQWVERVPEQYREGRGAVFVLPFKDSSKNREEILRQKEELSPELLLFMRHLKRVTIGDVTFERHKIPNKKLFKITRDDREEDAYWRKVSKTFDVPSVLQERLRKEETWRVKSREEVSIIIRTDENGNIALTRNGRLFAYLPTRELTEFPFHLQADFSLSAGRTELSGMAEGWNDWLLDKTGHLFQDLFEIHRGTLESISDFYRLLPTSDHVKEGLIKNRIKESIDRFMEKNNTIFTQTGVFKRPNEVRRTTHEAQKLISMKDLKTVTGRDYWYLDQSIDEQDIPYINEKIERLQAGEILSKNSLYKGKRKNYLWLCQLYAFLEDQMSEWEISENEVEGYPCIPSSTGFIKPSGKVFRLGGSAGIPRDIFEGHYSLVSKKFLDYLYSPKPTQALRKVRGEARDFLERMVPPLEPAEIVQKVINLAFEDRFDDYNETQLLKFTKFVKDNPDTWETARLRFLSKERPDDEAPSWCKPKELTLPREYKPRWPVEEICLNPDDIPFLSEIYINKFVGKNKPQTDKELDQWRTFFVEMGVNEYLPIQTLSEENPSYERLEGLGIPSKRSTRSARLIDYRLPLQTNIVEGHSPVETYETILQMIDGHWDYYKNYVSGRYHYFFSTPGTEIGNNSSFSKFLKNAKWVPTLYDNLTYVSNACLNTKRTSKYGTPGLPVISVELSNKDFIAYLGIEEGISTERIIEHLGQLATNESKEQEEFLGAYKALRKMVYTGKDSTPGDREGVRQSFKSRPLIFVPEHDDPYRTSKDVVWKSGELGTLRGGWWPPINRYYSRYKNLRTFFVENLGINETLTTSNYHEYLVDHLYPRSKLTEDEVSVWEHIVLNVIDDEFLKLFSQEQDEGRAVFKVWLEGGRWSDESENVYCVVNDDDRKLHGDLRHVLPIFYTSKSGNLTKKRYEELLRPLGIHRLSEVIEGSVHAAEGVIELNPLEIQCLLLCAESKLIAENPSYKRRIQEEFERLIQMTVEYTPHLTSVLSINGETVHTMPKPCVMVLNDKTCLYQTFMDNDNPKLVVTTLSETLADIFSFLKNKEGLYDFLFTMLGVISRKGMEDIVEICEFRGFPPPRFDIIPGLEDSQPPLPEDELLEKEEDKRPVRKGRKAKSPSSSSDKKAKKLSDKLRAIERILGPGREGEEHEKLKDWVAENPHEIGLIDVESTDVEYVFPSKDRVDILFRLRDDKEVVVEIETDAPYPGNYQALKYKALRCAERGIDIGSPMVEAVLIAWEIPQEIREFCERYEIRCIEKEL
ncbi:hypothetical protein MYX64_01250 [Nitrospinae bacterium AH_259_B05_G02_I21]|nr:hypothetical protein [Nitrospinae bacterium AH_259_B05_G02_I21]MDA2932188.1 hypothetical protein [Nitrospinae bacterium AH-259-F20]